MNNETVDNLIRKCPLCGKEYLKPKKICDKCDMLLVRLSQYEQLQINPIEFKQAQENLKQQNIPKCPTCGSTNIEKISDMKKAAGFLTVGVFSKNFGKTYHCKNCDYKW